MFDELARVRAGEIDRELAAAVAAAAADPDRPDPFGRGRRRRRWSARLLGAAPRPAVSTASAGLTIRPATAGDAPTLATLARLDDRRPPAGDVLVAELGDRIVAALPLDGRPVLTDPWRQVGDVVELLELRSEQLRLARRARAAA
ncbi:MAG: hypothetical protein R3C15_00425 [Thermoleophilia bacterium]